MLGDPLRLAFELRAAVGGAAVLPDDRARQWLARVAVPDHDGLTLVGDADRIGLHSAHRDGFARRGERALEDFIGVVLDPSRRWIVLGDLLISAPGDATVRADHQRSRAGRALIDRQDVLHRRIAAPHRYDRPAVLGEQRFTHSRHC